MTLKVFGLSFILMQNEIKIIQVKLSDVIKDHGKDHAKHLPAYLRFRYSSEIVYELENGQMHASSITGKTKPELKEKLARAVADAEKGCMKAIFNDGKFWGTSTSFRIC